MNVGLSTARVLFATLVTVVIPACNTGISGSEDSSEPGADYIRTVHQAVLAGPVQQAKLLASAGSDFDLFGLSVAISGDTALVGANRDDALGTDAGAAYVFVRSGTSWVQQ